jgi:hypothetical protein
MRAATRRAAQPASRASREREPRREAWKREVPSDTRLFPTGKKALAASAPHPPDVRPLRLLPRTPPRPASYRGAGVGRGGRLALTPASVTKSLSESEKKGQGAITVAVADFLADLRLSGSERVLGALALALAEGVDDSPAYARGKLARELREVLAELAKAELSPANLSLLEGVEL